MAKENDLNTIADALAAYQPAQWAQMPDIDLYMDQVVTFLKRQLELFQCATDANLLTPSIINNYAKGGVIERPVKKKYGRSQVGALAMACILKRVLPIESVKKLIADDGPVDEAFYGRFFEQLQSVMESETAFLREIGRDQPDRDMKELAAWFSMRACIDCLIADFLIATMPGQDKPARNHRRAE